VRHGSENAIASGGRYVEANSTVCVGLGFAVHDRCQSNDSEVYTLRKPAVPRGCTMTSLWEETMPRISDDIQNCTIYVYESQQDACTGNQAGGTGFLVEALSPKGILPHYYVITNKHVIEKATNKGEPIFVRLTCIEISSERRMTYKAKVMMLPASRWLRADSDDLAVCPIELSMSKYVFKVIPTKLFLTETVLGLKDIGVGDEVFMVGRFINHEGIQRNLPSARFGCIAQMPYEPVRIGPQEQQDSFLVECKSIAGYSGSPVFVWLRPGDKRRRETRDPEEFVRENGPWLLGVEWGFVPHYDYGYKVSDLETPISTKWMVHCNTGMSGVIPAWKLQALLDTKELARKRLQCDEEEEQRRLLRSLPRLT